MRNVNRKFIIIDAMVTVTWHDELHKSVSQKHCCSDDDIVLQSFKEAVEHSLE